MKVLIADPFEAAGVEQLKAAGCDVVPHPDLEGDALAQAIRDEGAEVLIVRGTKVTAAMLDANALALIVRAGRRLQHDRRRCGVGPRHLRRQLSGQQRHRRRRTGVRTDPRARSPHPRQVRDLRAGVWNKKEYSKAAGLFGRTLGLLGYGAIGQAMAERAGRAAAATSSSARRSRNKSSVDREYGRSFTVKGGSSDTDHVDGSRGLGLRRSPSRTRTCS